MAVQTVTEPPALDSTLQSTNTALGLLAKDTTVASIVTALALLGKDTSIQAVVTALGLLNKDATMVTQNSKLDTIIAKLQGIIEALGVDTSIYKAAGNKACADLTSSLLVAGNLGNVYNITDNGTTTADFVEGAGKPIHLGDNVAVVDIGEGGQHIYKFDLLAGIIDLSNYVQKSNTPGLLKNDGTVDETEYATTDDLEGVSDDVDAIEERMDADTTSISGNPISISGLKANQLAVNPIITFEPIQAGSGTPSPSNIRAISGYDKIEVLSCGRNLIPYPYVNTSKTQNQVTFTVNSDGSISLSGTATADASLVLMSVEDNRYSGYRLTGGISNAIYIRQRITDKNGTYIRATSDFGSGATIDSINPNTEKYNLLVWVASGTNCSGKNVYPMLQLESGASDTYEPYHKATSISESLGQTVYGGSLDVRTGVLMVTHKIVDMGDLSWDYSNGVFAANIAEGQKVTSAGEDSLFITDLYEVKKSASSSGYSDENNVAWEGFTSANYMIFRSRDSRYTDATTYKTAMNGHQICYQLATPFTIQLTQHEISLLKDYAYVSTNGTNIALDYHNGELASLADVSQLNETLERKVLRTEGHAYSTSEQIVGSWIDGKPVYEKTLHVTSIVANDNWQDIENLSIKLLIDFECIAYTSGGASGDQTSFRGDKNAPQIQAVSSTGYIRYALISGTSISELYITARYTKTTD